MISRKFASAILKRLQVYYPKTYMYWSDEHCAMFVDDVCETLSYFSEETVAKAYKAWHEEQSNAPSMADIIKRCRAIHNTYNSIPEIEFEFYTDKDGNEYARCKK